MAKLDDGAIISIAVESDKQATQARRGLRQWLDAEAFTAGRDPAFDVKTRLFRTSGGGLKLKIQRLAYGEGHMANRRGKPMPRRNGNGSRPLTEAERCALPPLPEPAAQL